MTKINVKSLVVVLTGATEGIGREIALQLASQGARLVLAARNSERLDQIVKECEDLGAATIGQQTDVAEAEQCRKLIAKTIDTYGALDVLINNAGITMWTTFKEIEDMEIFARLMDVNYLGAVYLTKAALPHLEKTRGRLVAVSSLAGLTGVPTRSGYAASKHAMFGFFESLRIELRGTGISVTMIAPDFVRSQIHKRAITADGSALGKSPLEKSDIMSAEECARHTIDAMMKRKRTKIMTPRGHLIRWLRILMPGLVDKLAYKAINQGN